jgi:hypothetical protein
MPLVTPGVPRAEDDAVRAARRDRPCTDQRHCAIGGVCVCIAARPRNLDREKDLLKLDEDVQGPTSPSLSTARARRKLPAVETPL